MTIARKNVVRVPFGAERRSHYRTCQWPFGHPGEANFHFCGAATHAPYSYCEMHAQMAYRDPEAERAAAAAAAQEGMPQRKSA